MLYFDWDPQKEAENLLRHGIDFGAASVALEDIFAIEEEDQQADGEERLRTTGMADGETIVIVCHFNVDLEPDGDELARIISARKASPGERRHYELQRAKNSGYSNQR